MDKICSVLMMIFLISFVPARAQTPVPDQSDKLSELRILVDVDSPPFAFREKGRLVGFDIDLGEALAKTMGAKAHWMIKPFDISTYASVLDAGQADAVLAALSITTHRKYFFDFSRPYLTTKLAVAVSPGTKWDPREFARGYMDRIIGVMKGTTSEKWARKNLFAQIKTYSSMVSLAQALNPGGNLSDAILADEPILAYMSLKGIGEFKLVEQGLGGEDYGVGVRKGNRQLASRISAALDQMEKEGVYARIYSSWFGSAPKDDK